MLGRNRPGAVPARELWRAVRLCAGSADPVGMSRPPRALPVSLPHAVFCTAEALAAGVDEARLRRGDLRSLSPGLWARRDRQITEREIVAALCRADPRAFAAGLTAARLWGLPLPGVLSQAVTEPPRQAHVVAGHEVRSPRGTPVDLRIHVATPGAHRRGTKLLRWSRMDAETVGLLDARNGPAIRLIPRVRTFLSLGAVLEVGPLVAIGDHLVRRPRPEYEGRSRPHATIPELMAAAELCTGRGIRRVREAITHVRMNSDSPPETALRLAMVASGLPEPLANAPAHQTLENGTLLDLGEPDLHWPQWRVALEHEGPTHLDRKQQERDIERGDRRRRAGWVELRTTAKDLREGCGAAVLKVRRELQRSGWEPR